MKPSILCEHRCSECGWRLGHGNEQHTAAQHKTGKHIFDSHDYACRNADGTWKDVAIKP